MGWLWLLAIALGSLLLLWRLGLPRGLWTFVGAAMMLAAAGYALQGHPMLAGKPADRRVEATPLDPQITALRTQMFGRFGQTGAYTVAADALAARGRTASSVRVMLGAVHKEPRSAAAWTGLGNAYSAHDGGLESPAAMLAFRRAMLLAPDNPGPPFFFGLAQVRAGAFEEARPLWARALALTPDDAPFREAIALRLSLLDQFLAMTADQAPPRSDGPSGE